MHPLWASVGRALARPFQRLEQKIAQADVSRGGTLGKILRALKKEASLGPTVHHECLAALRRMEKKDPSLRDVLKNAYGFAVIPRVGKASVVLGGAYGLGEVFVHDRVTAYTAIAQITVGVQLGGQTYSELLVFHSPDELQRFRHRRTSFAANASAVMVTSGAAASAGHHGTKVFVQPEGGMDLELDIGAQTFVYIPAALGRVRGWLEPASQRDEHLH